MGDHARARPIVIAPAPSLRFATMTKPDSARFESFPDTDLRFFRELGRRQDRDWFKAHKAEYERDWVAPMKALLDAIQDEHQWMDSDRRTAQR